MIVFSAIVPPSPLLIPVIGKDHTQQLTATLKAYAELQEHLIASRPDVIVVITTQTAVEYERFEINQSPTLVGTLSEFGDLDFSLERTGALGFCHHWKEQLEHSVDVHLCTFNELPYDATVPLFLLTNSLASVPIAVTSSSRASWGEHFRFGKESQHIFLTRKERIAVIVSGTLSPRLSPDSPAGFSLAGKSYDSMLIKHFRKWDTEAIRAMDPQLVEEAGAPAHQGILLMIGMLNGIGIASDILCYESPFGIGYMTAEFKIL
ncbi:MAG: hypothetical protein A3H59_02675 [Candidatus Jacksonbacteria bacterium RIFCSPLOWO2_02_FULL_43_9]|nr:MAG: AMMECR1 domain protein [Parcubacteria group bacterium GW2011_GWA2_43_13]OGY69324.1 MAG: hypothetical protein A3B94_03055 [Candidatus Jacksonbacteria bacterium RIFCSPHIGHO2_02_FULL_43_10]OGY71219.1 MAG: hypothetical protein A2986_00125 [Candidatus Jacksonbacteria bacterium RIFCSPLOWO2_01_FULL_44_13]OGY71918.1 MAG: hypothetical protein A3H59_02675 [Candidatus Jacksonbacteria bacterium RIFCSPLOWO2_02_FULL_43_9]